MDENKGPVIYIGPSYKDTEIHANQIFADGIPEKYKDDPVYKHLFVTAGELDVAQKEIKSTGSLRNIMYKRAMALHGGK